MNGGFPTLTQESVGDVHLACQTRGEGDLVVLVHGGVSDVRVWAHQVEALAEHYQVLAYSRRYARPNEDIPEGADDPMQPHVADLIALIEARGKGPAHVVGHSWGGFVSLLTAMARPDLVRSLVLIEPPVLSLFVDLPPSPWQLLRLLFRRPSLAFAVVKLGAGTMGPAEKAFGEGRDEDAIRIFGHGVLGKARFEALTEAQYQRVWDNRAADRAQMLGEGFPPLTPAMVRAVLSPVLLLAGDESPAVFRGLNQVLVELLPNAQQQIVPGASHIVQEDAPDQTNRAILDFLHPL